jgi:L-2-hydroxyglutarate oxidase LhgO
MQRTECDFLIIGAGITGLTVARELVLRGAENIVIVEKELSVGRHASGRNSGVLHAGIYYTPDSMKAKYCVEGNRLMKAYCRDKNLKLVESGKVIVAVSETELPALYELKRRADLAGSGAEIIDERQLNSIEPFAFTVKNALYSPQTAVIDPLEILNALLKDLETSGRVRVYFGSEFLSLKESSMAVTGSGQIKFKMLVNAAGVNSDKIAHKFGLAKKFRSLPFKGTYKKLRSEKSYLVKGSIYPVPDVNAPFLGVHFTRGIDNVVYIGPTAIPALGRENYALLKDIDIEFFEIVMRNLWFFLKDPSFRRAGLGEIKKKFTNFLYRDAKKLLPAIEKDDIIGSDKVGIRPQLIDIDSGKLVMDFVVIEDSNSIHILNAISPAFTSSMAFAKMLCDRIT